MILNIYNNQKINNDQAMMIVAKNNCVDLYQIVSNLYQDLYDTDPPEDLIEWSDQQLLTWFQAHYNFDVVQQLWVAVALNGVTVQ